MIKCDNGDGVLLGFDSHSRSIECFHGGVEIMSRTSP